MDGSKASNGGGFGLEALERLHLGKACSLKECDTREKPTDKLYARHLIWTRTTFSSALSVTSSLF